METTCPQYMVLDISKFPAMERNFRVIQAFQAIEPHCFFTVMTDQNPVSLHREFEGELKGRFLWKTIQEGPPEWKILITKTSN